MFQQLIASNTPKTPRKPLTLVLSAIIHGLLVLLLIAVPLVHPETLANLQTLIAPPPPLSAPRRAVVNLVSSAGKPKPVVTKPNILFRPDFIPPKIGMNALGASENTGAIGEVPQTGFPISEAGGSDRFLEGFGNAPRAVPIPESPAPTEKRETLIPIVRRGGEVQHANLVHQVKPVYPQPAIIMRVQGAVILEAVINREGRVADLRVLSGNPLLVRAACDAVLRWRYRPTLLNGQPVEVLTQVTVNFSLGTP